MEYKKERLEGVPCAVCSCIWWSSGATQNCVGEDRDRQEAPTVRRCVGYKPSVEDVKERGICILCSPTKGDETVFCESHLSKVKLWGPVSRILRPEDGWEIPRSPKCPFTIVCCFGQANEVLMPQGGRTAHERWGLLGKQGCNAAMIGIVGRVVVADDIRLRKTTRYDIRLNGDFLDRLQTVLVWSAGGIISLAGMEGDNE